MAEWPRPDIMEAFIGRMPERDRKFRDSLTRLQQYAARHGEDDRVLEARRAMVGARTAIRRFDDELRIDWEWLTSVNHELRAAEHAYWRQRALGGVGLGAVAVFLIIVVVIALAATGALVNASYQRARPSLIRAYASAQVAIQNGAEARRIAGETMDASILVPVEEREPTTAEAISRAASATLSPVAIAAGVGLLLWVFGKAAA